MSPAETTGAAGLDELDAARARAIELTGWGAGIRFLQPRNLAFWVWAALVGWGAVKMVQVFRAPVAYYTPALTIAFVVFALYGALLWWFTQRIDRYASQPGLLRVMGFLWGGFAATWVIALPANTALSGIYSKLFGQQFEVSWGAAFSAPLTEEWGKGIGLLLLIAIAPHVVRTAFDGFILGAFLGLGFQTFENVFYSMNAAGSRFGSDAIEASQVVLLIRTTTGVGGHILFSAIFCTGLVLVLGRPGQPRRAGLGVLLVLAAMVLHFVFDSGAALAELVFGPGAVAELLVFLSIPGTPLLALLVLWRVFPLAVGRERGLMRDMLAPEVARGVVTEEEAAAAAGDGRSRRHFRASEKDSGHRNSHVLEAVFDLASELGRSAGAETDRVRFARAEVTRLRSAGQVSSTSRSWRARDTQG